MTLTTIPLVVGLSIQQRHGPGRYLPQAGTLSIPMSAAGVLAVISIEACAQTAA